MSLVVTGRFAKGLVAVQGVVAWSSTHLDPEWLYLSGSQGTGGRARSRDGVGLHLGTILQGARNQAP